jgi:hypothetical protein
MIISSDCTASIIYKRIIGKEYTNPFMSTIVSASDFNYVIENLNNIDFLNYELYSLETKNFNDVEPTYGIYVDGKVKILFPHHNDPETITGMYSTRAKRMVEKLEENPDIVFIMAERDLPKGFECNYDKDDLEHFCALNTPYKRMLITKDGYFKKFENDKLKIHIKVNEEYLCIGTIRYTRNIIFDKYKDYILDN